MRRVECVGLDFSNISVVAVSLKKKQRYATNSGEPRIAIYFSTETSAEPLNVRDRPGTIEALMPAEKP